MKPIGTKKKIPGLFRLEMQKLMFHQKGALLLMLVLLLQPRFYVGMHARITTDELRYLAAIKTAEGEYTEEKQESLIHQRNELNTRLSRTSDMLMQNELSARLTAVEQVIALGSYLQTRDEPVAYVYETGYEAMFGLRPVGVRYQNWIISVTLCLMLPGIFTLDGETGIDSLLRTTVGVRKLRNTKWRIAFLTACVVFLICWLPEFQFIINTYDLSGWSAPLVSIQAFAAYPGFLPVWCAVVGLWLYRYAITLLICAIVCRISEKSVKNLTAVILSALIAGAVHLLVP